MVDWYGTRKKSWLCTDRTLSAYPRGSSEDIAHAKENARNQQAFDPDYRGRVLQLLFYGYESEGVPFLGRRQFTYLPHRGGPPQPRMTLDHPGKCLRRDPPNYGHPRGGTRRCRRRRCPFLRRSDGSLLLKRPRRIPPIKMT